MKKNKITGLIGTAVLHILLLILLLVIAIHRPQVQEEGGVPVMLGNTELSQGNADPYTLTDTDIMNEPEAPAPDVSEPETVPPVETKEEIITQTEEETVAVPKKEPKKETPRKEKPKKETPKKDVPKKEAVKPKEKTEAEKRAEAEKAAAEKKAAAERAAAEAAAKKIAGAFGKGTQMGNKGTGTQAPVWRVVRRETLRKGSPAEWAVTEHLTSTDVLWVVAVCRCLSIMCRMRDGW